MEKLEKKKPINGLFLFFSSAILLILTLQLVDFFINLFFGLDNGNIQEKNNTIFSFLFFLITFIPIFLCVDFYRTKLDISRKKIVKLFTIAILFTTLNSFFIKSSLNLSKSALSNPWSLPWSPGAPSAPRHRVPRPLVLEAPGSRGPSASAHRPRPMEPLSPHF